MPVRLPSIFERMASRLEPAVGRAFRRALEAVRASLDLRELEEYVRTGQDPAELFDELPGAMRRQLVVVEAVITGAIEESLQVVEEAVRELRWGTRPAILDAPRWDITNEAAVQWAQTRSAQLVTAVTEEQRRTIQLLTRDAFLQGRHPHVTARLLYDTIGLTPRLAQAVRNMDLRLAADGVRDDRRIRQVAAYGERLRRFRARVIARTETLMASNRGQDIVWERALSGNAINGDYIRREWIVAKDERTCKICAPMNGQLARINGVWMLANGKAVRTPTESHPQCRCTSGLVFLDPPEWQEITKSAVSRGDAARKAWLKRRRARWPGPGRPDARTPSEPGFLYHATNEEALSDIAAGGLRTHRPWYGTDQRVWPDGGRERRAYFTEQAGFAWQFAPEHGRPALLRARAEKVATRRESTSDPITRSRVKPGVLEVLGADGQWYPLDVMHPANARRRMAKVG
jgi:hypothetical protein